MKTINWHIVALFFSFCWAQLKIYGLKTFVVCHASLYFDKSWTLPVCLNPDQTYCSLFCFAPVCTIGAYHLINLSLLKRGVQTFSSKDCIQIVDRRVQGPLDIFHLLFFSLKSIHLCWQRYVKQLPFVFMYCCVGRKRISNSGELHIFPQIGTNRHSFLFLLFYH